jgi:hypothetical protein
MKKFGNVPYPVYATLLAAKVILVVALLAGCSTPPSVRVDKVPGATISQYRTFAFYDPLATDRSNYTTLVSQHLKQSTRDELERHGYVFDDRNPDLKVNFNVRITARQELRSYPTANGVFVRRIGVQDVDVVNYRQGQVSIDLVDNHLKSLVWQGVADGRVDDRMIEEPGKAIDGVVKQIFIGFPLSQK